MDIDQILKEAHDSLNKGQIENARDCLEKIPVKYQDLPETRKLAGYLCLQKGDSRLALKTLIPIVPHFEDDAEIYHRIGLAWHNLKVLENAVGAYQRALSLNPSFLPAQYDLGCALLEQGEFINAIDCFQQCMSVDPNPYVCSNLAKAYFGIGDIEKAIECYRRFESEQNLINVAAIIPGSPNASQKDILEVRQRVARLSKSYAKKTEKSRLKVRNSGHETLNIGYISSFFHRPNWMKPVWALLNHHDRSRFRIFLFSDASREAVIGKGDGYIPFEQDVFVDCQHMSNKDLADAINDADLDILIDLNGYSELDRLRLFFEYRLKPITVAWFNMYATSGLPGYEFLIGDQHVVKDDETNFYTEKIVKLSTSYLTFCVTYKVPDIVLPPSLENGYITFGSLASLYKITPDMISDWASILKKCPQTRLILRNAGLSSVDNRKYIQNCFAAHDIQVDRITLLGRAEHFTFLTTYADIDIALDSYPYNGGTTTTEAIWQGVPVITFDGDRWVSRTSKTILNNTHLKDFVRKNKDDYIDHAIYLANSPQTPDYLKKLRLSMRSSIKTSKVYDVQTFTGLMEQAYLKLIDI